jgi:hypothetical protein
LAVSIIGAGRRWTSGGPSDEDAAVNDVVISEDLACQLAYHLRMAAGFAAVGDAAECASEATLAWTLVAGAGVHLAERAAQDLPALRLADVTEGQWDTVRRRTEALALSLQAHFVSEGQHATAAMYEAAASAVAGTVEGFRSPPR